MGTVQQVPQPSEVCARASLCGEPGPAAFRALPVIFSLPVPIALAKLTTSEKIPLVMIDPIGFLALCPAGEGRKIVMAKLKHSLVSIQRGVG